MPISLPAYPGRGVAAYRDADGALWWLYFLTGRSEASRSRAFAIEADRISIVPSGDQPRDELRHYACVRRSSKVLVVGNGDHVDLIVEALDEHRSLSQVLGRIEPEPDPPINTPRIALVADDGVRMVSVRDLGGEPARTLEQVEVADGHGVILHTYAGDVATLTADAVTRDFISHGTGADVAREIWNALDPGLRVGLVVGRVPEPAPTDVLTRD